MRFFVWNEFVGAIMSRNCALEHLEEFTNESKLASNLNLITTANLKKVQYLYYNVPTIFQYPYLHFIPPKKTL